MPHTNRNMQQLETEITRVQIELRQIRQMIGSLIRTEEKTMQMLSQQPGMQGQGMQGQGMQGAAYGGALDPSTFNNSQSQGQGQGGYSQNAFSMNQGSQQTAQQGFSRQASMYSNPSQGNHYGGAIDPSNFNNTGHSSQRSGQQGLQSQQGMYGSTQASSQQGQYQGQGTPGFGQQGMNSGQQGMPSNASMPVPPQLLNEERRAMEQYNEMRSVAERMDKQVQNIAQAINMDRYNPNNYSAQQMNPPYNDPMQRQQ